MKKRTSCPILKAKGFNALCIVDWLACLCADQAVGARHIEYYSDRATMLWGLSTMFCIMRRSGTWLSVAQRQVLRSARNAYFALYWKLGSMAVEDGRPLYTLQPKHHMLDHIEKSAFQAGLNPAS